MTRTSPRPRGSGSWGRSRGCPSGGSTGGNRAGVRKLIGGGAVAALHHLVTHAVPEIDAVVQTHLETQRESRVFGDARLPTSTAPCARPTISSAPGGRTPPRRRSRWSCSNARPPPSPATACPAGVDNGSGWRGHCSSTPTSWCSMRRRPRPIRRADGRSAGDSFARRRGETVLMIVHRLPTVTGADRIVVVRDVRITESGPHRQLIAADGTSADLRKAGTHDDRHRHPLLLAHRPALLRPAGRSRRPAHPPAAPPLRPGRRRVGPPDRGADRGHHRHLDGRTQRSRKREWPSAAGGIYARMERRWRDVRDRRV